MFADKESDRSLIVEILQYEEVPDSEAAKHYFADLCQYSEVAYCTVLLCTSNIYLYLMLAELLVHTNQNISWLSS